MTYDRLALAKSCHRKCRTATLFIVRNTADKPLYVIAKDFACARWIALHHDHIRALENGKVFKAREDWLAEDIPFRSALRRAVADGSPGAITRVGDSAVIIEDHASSIEGKIYPPLSSVK